MTRRDAWPAAAAVAGIAAVTAAYTRLLHVTNATIVALTFLLLVLLVAATSRLWLAVLTSIAAVLCFNYFFLPPVGTWTIADPQNWVALFVFLAVSLVASHLSSVVRARTGEAVSRRDEVARLFDLSRDVLSMTDDRETIAELAHFVSRRFDLDFTAICLPRGDRWEIFDAGPLRPALDPKALTGAFSGAERVLEFDARTRTYEGQRHVSSGGVDVRLVPLRLATTAVGLMAAAGRRVEPGTLDAIAGVAAMAIERVQLLESRKSAEIARRSEELKSALLASLSHDLRTPLTAIRVAVSNLRASWLTDEERREQSEVALVEVERLTRLFQNILEMARIDAGGTAVEPRFVPPFEIVDAARAQVEHTTRAHDLRVNAESTRLVCVDPRLTAAALAHLMENAAQYSPSGAPIDVVACVVRGELELTVRDRGPGIAAADLPRIFDRFYRGSAAAPRVSGTGMGLAIARGLLAAEHGRIWAENCPGGGARFTIVVPAESRDPEAAALEPPA